MPWHVFLLWSGSPKHTPAAKIFALDNRGQAWAPFPSVKSSSVSVWRTILLVASPRFKTVVTTLRWLTEWSAGGARRKQCGVAGRLLWGAVVFLLCGAFEHALAPPGPLRQSVSAAQSQLQLQGKHCAILSRRCQTADPTKQIQLFLRVSFPIS